MHEEIRIALTKLHQDNKNPTLALLKSRLGRPFPMPELIAALNEWKRDPRPADLSRLTAPPVQQAETRVEVLQKEVKQLKAQVARLTARLDKLEQQ